MNTATKQLRNYLVLLFAIATAGTSSALSLTGALHNIDADSSGDWSVGDYSTVDSFQFYVEAGETVTFDLLAFELFVDLNSDGTLSFLDTTIYLFDDAGTELAMNDDDGLWLDSFLSHTFVASGTYTLAIGQYYLSAEEARSGMNNERISGFNISTFSKADPFSFDAFYQLDVLGNVSSPSMTSGPLAPSPVPEPATATLMALGLGGLVLSRKRILL